MAEQPTLLTERLLLRRFTLEDASCVQQLAGVRAIADTTISIPHPYEFDDAENWIAKHSSAFIQGTAIHFGIEIRETHQLVGAIELGEIDREHLQSELSFWIGIEFWGRGFASEAGQCLLRYGFKQLHLNRIYAHYMVRNPASGKVLQKIGMRQEGLMRQRVRKWGIFEDVVLCAVLHTDWSAL